MSFWKTDLCTLRWCSCKDSVTPSCFFWDRAVYEDSGTSIHGHWLTPKELSILTLNSVCYGTHELSGSTDGVVSWVSVTTNGAWPIETSQLLSSLPAGYPPHPQWERANGERVGVIISFLSFTFALPGKLSFSKQCNGQVWSVYLVCLCQSILGSCQTSTMGNWKPIPFLTQARHHHQYPSLISQDPWSWRFSK